MMRDTPNQERSIDHPFVRAPNVTLVSLGLPVLFSLIAEPLTGLVDTFFVAQLGTPSLAALGVGVIVLSSIFWVFGFLQVGTQTEVAQLLGRAELQRACELSGLALLMGGSIGVALIGLVWPLLPFIATSMGATDAVYTDAVTYMQMRLVGAPAVLAMLTSFGILRGLQDMRTPSAIAIAVNVLNILLDWLLIFGAGPLPALGIGGAALASTLSQWLGAVWAVGAVLRRLGIPARVVLSDARRLLQIGGDLFIRTGMLTAFLLLTTRTATQISAEAGAAHQVIRQVWTFAALFLDAFALTGQSLVGFFVGAQAVHQARRVAYYICVWSLGTGAVIGLAMVLGQTSIASWLVPREAQAVFFPAWLAAALLQPINALSFATDGVHWGTGDYAFLRNVMLLVTLIGGAVLLVLAESNLGGLLMIWLVTGLWSTLRAVLGLVRIWPGVGRAPLALAAARS